MSITFIDFLFQRLKSKLIEIVLGVLVGRIYFIFYLFLFYFGGGCVCIAEHAGINSRITIRNRGDGATRGSYLEFSLTVIVS